LLAIPLDRQDARQIDLDVERTMRTHSKYGVRYGPGQCQLYRILHAYAVLDAECKYTQGMAFLASIVLIYLDDEENAFWGFVRLMYNYSFHDLYANSLQGLQDIAIPKWEELMKEYLPEIAPHMEKYGPPTTYYLTNWFLELFYAIIPFSLMLKIYDVMILFGSSILFSFSLALMSANQEEILKCYSIEDFHQLLRIDPVNNKDHQMLLKLATKQFRLEEDVIFPKREKKDMPFFQ